ncbi:cytochrome c family protein [Psychroserpens sp. MEBiC05023]
MKISIKFTIGIALLIIGQSCTTAIIDEGDKNSLPPLTREVTYQSDIQSIMTNNCITCHAGPAPNAGLDLSNYQNTRFSAEQGSLVSRMNNALNPMPPSGKLSPQVLQIIDKWVADNFPEN